ncbi:NADH kinase pos5 [Thecaphora frezii]
MSGFAASIPRSLLRFACSEAASFPRLRRSPRGSFPSASTPLSFHHASTSRHRLSYHSQPCPLITPCSRRSFSSSRHCADKTEARLRPTLEDLPDKVDVEVGPAGRLAKVLPPRRGNKITTRVGSSYAGNHTFSWMGKPSNVLIVKKANEERATKAMRQIIHHIGANYPHMNVIVEKQVIDTNEASLATDFPDLVPASGLDKAQLARKTDFVITLGGDGSILHVSSLFDRDAVPPVLSFSMGTLGFLLPYDISSFREAFRELFDGNVTLLLRMRLKQTSHRADGEAFCQLEEMRDGGGCYDVHLMNEVALHRGREPHMTMIDAYVDGQYLTQAISDGLIVATPTGSTAYSLSAGGPIVHPSVQSLVLTPICPRSLSFRTVLLPSDSVIQLKISSRSRSPAELTIDGRISKLLQPGEYLQVSMSPFPIPCVNRRHAPIAPSEAGPASYEKYSDRGEDDWVRDINTLLKFNASFGGRGTLGGNGGFEEDDAHGGV